MPFYTVPLSLILAILVLLFVVWGVPGVVIGTVLMTALYLPSQREHRSRY